MPRRRHRRNRLGPIALALALLIVAAGAGAWAVFLNQTALKANLAEAVLRATGRTLTVSGPVSLHPGTSALVVVADGVALANVPGGSRPEMAEAARVEATIAWRPLLDRDIVVERLVVVKPSLLLEINADGVPNWRFQRRRAPDGPASSPPDASPGQPRDQPRGQPWEWSVRSVELRDGEAVWRDSRSGISAQARIQRMTIAAASGQAPIALDGDVESQGVQTRVSGEVGSWTALRSGAEAAPWPIRVTAQNPIARVAFTGGIARPLEAKGYAFALDARAPNLAALSGLAGVALPALRDVSVTARVADTGARLPDFSDVVIHAGATDFPATGRGALHIEGLDIQLPRMDAPIRGQLDGTLSGTALKLSASLGAPAALLPGAARAPFPVDFRAEAAGADLRVIGAVAQPASFAGLDLAVSGAIPDLAALSPIAGRTLPGFTALDLAAHVTDQDGSYRQGIAVRDIVVTSPQGDVSGTLAWRFAERPEVRADLSSRRLDLDAVRAVLSARPIPGSSSLAAPDAPASLPAPNSPVEAQPAPPGQADQELPFAALNRLDGEVKWTIGALQVGGMTLAEFVGRVAARGGKLTIDPVGGQGAGGRFDLTASADASAAEPPVTLFVHGNGIALKPVLSALGVSGEVSGSVDLSVDLHAQGRSLKALEAGLDGHAGLALADGEIDNAMLSGLLGNVLRAAKLPGEFGQGKTAIRCLALKLDATRGRVAVSTMLLDSPRLMLQGLGEIDLAHDTIALRLRPLLRIGGPGLAVPLRVSGTPRQPKVALDSGGLLGALIGAQRPADACAPALASARRP